MQKKIRCLLCDETDELLLNTIDVIEGIERVLCRSCGLIFFAKKPKKDSVYDFNYNIHFHRPGDIRKAGIMAAKIAELANTLGQQPRILEIGPGNGLTAFLLQAMHYHIIAVERDKETALYIKERLKVPTIHHDFENGLLFTGYDVIYAGHVIEHSWNPIGFLTNAYQTLGSGGYLFIDTPNNHYYKIHGIEWKHMKTRQPFEHCSLFGIQTAYAAAQLVGFNIVSIETLPEFQNMHIILSKD